MLQVYNFPMTCRVVVGGGGSSVFFFFLNSQFGKSIAFNFMFSAIPLGLWNLTS